MTLTNVTALKRRARPLRKTYRPDSPYSVHRDDEDSGAICYKVHDERPESYRVVCVTDDEGGMNPHAKRDAERIARGLNLLVQYGLEPMIPEEIERE